VAVAQVMDSRVNPSNPKQRVVLWSNARIDVYGGPPITDGPEFYDRPDQPVVVAIRIANWTTMAGYLLDKHGGFHLFNGAPAVGVKSNVRDTDTHYVVTGVPYLPSGLWYWDWAWDPDVPGRGIAMDVFGNLHPFGGATAPPRVGRRWASPLARKLAVRWRDSNGNASMRAYTLGYDGSINRDYAGTVAVTSPWRWNSDMAVDLVVTDWDTGSGYMLDRNGGTWAFGQATGTYSPGYKLGADVARTLEVLSPANPLSFWRVGPGGQETEWTWSTPPTVIAGGADPQSPAAEVKGTTRPVLAWSYSDLQSDSQALVELLVFNETFAASSNMTDPAKHRKSALVDFTTIDPMLRGIASPVDLANGGKRMYVRAQDSAGQWSPWSTRLWTQNVPKPAAPTALTAVADEATATVSLTATASVAGTGNLLRFEWSDDPLAVDDPDEVTWYPVRTADALPVAATVIGVDRDARLGVPRTYRAVRYSLDPRTASNPSPLATAVISRRCYRLTALTDPALGGEIRAAESLDWTRALRVGVQDTLYPPDHTGVQYPTAISSGAPSSRRGTLTITVQNRAQWEIIKALGEADSVLLLRDPFGEAIYCRAVGDWPQRLLEAQPLLEEVAEGLPIRHMHSTSLPLVELRPPHLAA